MAVSRRGLLGLAAAVAGCASPNPALYVIEPVPGAEAGGVAGAVDVRAVSLARYLERSQIVRSTEGYRVELLENEWWAEPLDALLGRVLVADLAQRLPGASVFADNGAVSSVAGQTVEVNVSRLDVGRDGALVLAGLVAVSGRVAATRGVSFAVRPADGTTVALVAAASVAVGQLADTVAGMLRARG